MKQTLYYDSLQNALAVQMNMKALDGIEADGPGEIDQDGYYAVSWSSEHALQPVQRGRIIRLYEPDGVAFNLIHELLQPDQVQPIDLVVTSAQDRLDEGFHGVDEECDHAQPPQEEKVSCDLCGSKYAPDDGYFEPGEYSYCSECCHW